MRLDSADSCTAGYCTFSYFEQFTRELPSGFLSVGWRCRKPDVPTPDPAMLVTVGLLYRGSIRLWFLVCAYSGPPVLEESDMDAEVEEITELLRSGVSPATCSIRGRVVLSARCCASAVIP